MTDYTKKFEGQVDSLKKKLKGDKNVDDFIKDFIASQTSYHCANYYLEKINKATFQYAPTT